MLRTLIKYTINILSNERGFIATSTLLAGAAIAAVVAGGVTAIAASAGGGKGGGGGAGPAPEAPKVGSGSQDISREEMRKRGRAALISTSSQGVLENAPTGRSQLLAN